MSDAEERWLEVVDPEVLRRRRERLALLAGALLVFATAIVIAVTLNKADTGSASDVYLAAQGAVASQLAPKGRLDFSSQRETRIECVSGDSASGPQQYLVRGWVHDIAAGGQVAAYLFTAYVDRDPATHTDTVHGISVLPQN
jgi:hypothetical protein